MIPRRLEPEIMDTLTEAVDYDTMDHSEVNRRFVYDLLAAAPPSGPILDLGTGTAQIPIELARQRPSARIVAVDASRHMLRVADQNVRRAGLGDRIELQQVDAKRLPYPDGSFTTVMSNSIVHHVPHPEEVVNEAWRVAAPGGLLFVRDLARPDDDPTVARLVETYAGAANPHQQKMFGDSLRAALTVDEMSTLVVRLGADRATVTMTSDRHWTWVARKPGHTTDY
ncbi:MAG: class I SAM-dependent methyltransferase [Pirellulales bacterium]|nr:class I SAM-dependent methyltransferase [Pirellulales bacterium]